MTAILVPSPHSRPAPRPRLTLIEGGRSEQSLDRIYRRRRLVALVMAVVVAVAIIGLARVALHAVTPQAPAATQESPAVPPGTPTVSVRAGDTLWSIARRIQPEGEVRGLVDRLSASHGPGALQVGEPIPVPS